MSYNTSDLGWLFEDPKKIFAECAVVGVENTNQEKPTNQESENIKHNEIKINSFITMKLSHLKALLIIILIQFTFFIPLDTRENHYNNDCSGDKVFAGLGNILDIMFTHCAFISGSRVIYMVILNILIVITFLIFTQLKNKKIN
jgi:hypothetical protein